jgi:hypothetical protein
MQVLYKRQVTGARQRIAGRLGALAFAALLILSGAGACGKPSKRVKAGSEAKTAESSVCARDEVREYSCESLLPIESALPAPHPYETCPYSLEVKDVAFPPKGGTGTFDSARTELARGRSPPGQQCCYSWCGKLQVVDAEQVEDRCRQPLAFRESTCIAELESGTKGETAASPFDRCALAIRPPGTGVFSVPTGAFLDPNLSAARRQRGESLCCYSWCSIAPPGMSMAQ